MPQASTGSHSSGHDDILHTALAAYTCRLDDLSRRADSSTRQPVKHKSHLSSKFELLGRTGDWNPVSQTGNPMLSVQTRNVLKGYSIHASQLGYQKTGTVPLKATATSEHGQHLQQQQHRPASATATAKGWYAVQLAMAVLINAGAVRLDNVLLPISESAMPYLVPV